MDMDTINAGAVVAVTAGAVVLGVAAYELYKTYNAYQRGHNGVATDRVKILEETFGEPMHTGTFTLGEAVTWMKSHFSEGCQGAIFRTDCAGLKSYAPNLNLGKEEENYLVMAIVDEASKTMRDRVLVKFDVLDSGLEDALGDEGMLVIEP